MIWRRVDMQRNRNIRGFIQYTVISYHIVNITHITVQLSLIIPTKMTPSLVYISNVILQISFRMGTRMFI